MVMTPLERFRALLVVAALMPWPLLAGQANWWAFPVVTAAILVALRLLLGEQWANSTGLKLQPINALAALAAFALVATGTKVLLASVYAANDLKANIPQVEQQFGLLFQSLNEEIPFRALMIGFVLQYFVRSPSFPSDWRSSFRPHIFFYTAFPIHSTWQFR